MSVLFCLFGWHFLADFPLQGDFLSKAKNHNTAIPGVPWWYALLAHSAIHGFGVMLITGSILLGLIETALHFGIDYFKCEGKTNFVGDQCLHFLCKIFIWFLYLVIIVTGGDHPGREAGAMALWTTRA